MTDDVFGTAALRRAVLEAWRSSPTRLREDANTEEDHAHGSYRGRVVVELAQNAADAAARAGVPGRLRLSLHAPSGAGEPWVLRAANTGAPLDTRGVASLVAMRASATGEAHGGAVGAHAPVGRFGVGFAAVRSVADEVRVGSGGRAVELSLARTRAALADAVVDLPDLAAEVARRGDRVPVLRLPFPAHVEVPPGYDTVVELELRDRAALDDVRTQLDDVGDALLLALPALVEVVVADDRDEASDERSGPMGERRVADVAERWTVVRRDGPIDPGLLADRPVEERAAARWAVTWALPRDPTARTAVLQAPTPTDERLTFPALLLATFPLDPSRRHVPPGPLTEHVAQQAGTAYADLLAALAPERGADVLGLVPTGLPASAVDASVRSAAEAALRRTPLLPLDAPRDAPAEAGGLRLVAPADATFLAGEVGDARVRSALGVAHLVDVPAPLRAVARSLGAQVLDLADVVDDLPLVADPERWRSLYDALAPHAHDRAVLEALGAVPVPLAGGRVVPGARGLLLLDTDALDPQDAAALGLRVVDPRAAHPLLERLGARTTDLRGVLHDDALRERVLAAADAVEPDLPFPGQARRDDPAGDVDHLLGLVRAAVREAGGPARDLDLPFWWGELPVPTAAGGSAPARGCVLPGSWAATVLDGLDLVTPDVVERWGEEVLRAVGAVVGPVVHRVRDVLTPATTDPDDPSLVLAPHAPEAWLSDWSGYLAHLAAVLGPEVYVGDLLAVADLDAVADDAWPDVLARLAADPDARVALLAPVRVEVGGRARVVPSYTAWWLREELGGPFAVGAVAFVRPAPPELAGLDDEVLAALGGVRSLGELDPQDWVDVLDALPHVGAPVPARDALALWRALAVLAQRGERLDPAPDRVPALRGEAVVVADAEDVVVGPDPMWAPVRPLVPSPAGLVDDVADVLDVAVAPEPVPAPDVAGTTETVSAAARSVCADVPTTWERHAELTVRGAKVPWWVQGSGTGAVVHATGPRALARALAVAAGRYELRHVLEEVLVDPTRAEHALAVTFWDGPQPSESAPR